ncbi:MAG: ABC transporter substrate-binding protein [Caulobacteraceae bacterium]
MAAALLAALGPLAVSVAHADQLDDIRKAGVIKVAVFDSNPPFGALDARTRALVGYDIDFAQAIARKLGVRLELTPTNPANRIPLLQSHKVDLLVADVSITPERRQVLDFSYPYFVTGQKLVAGVQGPEQVEAYAAAPIAAVKGTTGEQNIKQRFPHARVISYDDLPAAFTALRAGRVQAVTQDASVLVGILAVAPDRQRYKLLPQAISREEVGIATRKGERRLLDQVNQTLLGLEADGGATRIYDRWFGKSAAAPQPRGFTIAAPKG